MVAHSLTIFSHVLCSFLSSERGVGDLLGLDYAMDVNTKNLAITEVGRVQEGGNSRIPKAKQQGYAPF